MSFFINLRPSNLHFSVDAGTRFGVWRALLGPDARIASPAALKERLLQLRDDAGLWAVILNR